MTEVGGHWYMTEQDHFMEYCPVEVVLALTGQSLVALVQFNE